MNVTTFVKKSDLYCCFIERSVSLLKHNGMFGYIVSNGWLRLDSFENLRNFLLDQTSLQTVIDFTGNVFDRATVKTAILVLSKGNSRDQSVKVATTEVTSDLINLEFRRLQQDVFRDTYKSIFDLSKNFSSGHNPFRRGRQGGRRRRRNSSVIQISTTTTKDSGHPLTALHQLRSDQC